MGLRHWLDDLRPRFQTNRAYRAFGPLFDMLERFLYSSGSATVSAPHVRSTVNVQRRNCLVVLASVPAALIGIWNLGCQPGSLAGSPAYERADVASCILGGALQFLPLLVTAVVVSVFWESAFANARRRPAGDGVFLTAWLFALIVPPTLPLYQAALAMSFGFVFGRAVFGGANRYIVNPSLLGLVFLIFAYPQSITDGSGAEQAPLLELAASGAAWWGIFPGDSVGPVGVTSAAAGLVAGLFLIAAGIASWRVITGAVMGLAGCAFIVGNIAGDAVPLSAIPWHWHLILGGFAFAIVFLATDPATSPITNAGRWAYGVLIGVLTVLIRLGNPIQIEAVIFAILFASIVAPVFDFLVAELHIRRRQRRLRTVGS